MMNRMSTIYHITLPDAWATAQAGGSYAAASLGTEGFIHCSTAEQVERSLNRFYTGVPEVLVLAIDPEHLAAELKYERAHGEMFPHIYGPLNVDAVKRAEAVAAGPDGAYKYWPGSV